MDLMGCEEGYSQDTEGFLKWVNDFYGPCIRDMCRKKIEARPGTSYKRFVLLDEVLRETPEEKADERAAREVGDMVLGAWELNPCDPMAPAYDAFYAFREEISRIRKSPQDFRDGLMNACYHLINILTGRWDYEPPWLSD